MSKLPDSIRKLEDAACDLAVIGIRQQDRRRLEFSRRLWQLAEAMRDDSGGNGARGSLPGAGATAKDRPRRRG
jgi:hypothetical protein